MGCCKSKSDDEADDTPIYQTKNIYYDVDGNLRCGNVDNDKDEELRQITLGDAFSTKLKGEEGIEWYIVDTNWFNSWMAFVHFDRNSSPNPGPCRNDRLIRFDEPSGLWIPRPFLQPTDKRTNGNYSLLTESLWEVFKERYPGSGPEIKYTYYRHHHEKGRKQVTLSEDHKDIVVLSDEEDEGELYPPQHWIIDQRHGLEGGSDTATDEVGKSEGMFGTTGAGADSGSGLIIGSIEEEEGGRGGKQKGVYHQLNDISQTPLSARDIGIHSLDEEGEREGKTGRKGDSRQTPDEYEHMVDTTITGGDRKNILSFFGSQGEDMDFHVSKDEIISDKYSRGLGGAKEGGDESPVSIAVSTKQEKIEDRGQEKRQEWN